MGTKNAAKDLWESGDSYEPYVGRWSRLVAREFIPWLAVPEGKRWLEVGSGTGVLSQIILEKSNPALLKGIDRSEGFVEFAQSSMDDPRVEFEVGNAQALPVQSESFDVAVSGLVLNFVPQPDQMIAEMARVVCNGGMVALYVWDYAGKMQMLRHFWNAASVLDPAARELDEGWRFSICNPTSLNYLFQHAGLSRVEIRPIDILADFKDFNDYWSPFLGGQGPAPGYVMSLDEKRRAQLRDKIYNSLPFALDGTIPLLLRGWAVKGIK
jgi:SAM-dependent methyltransferase